MDSHTVPFNPVNPIVRRSLDTLLRIQYSVHPSSFTLAGLSRGLGIRDTNALHAELDWLVKNGFIQRISLVSMRLTLKGRIYEEMTGEESEGFEIEFFSRDPEPRDDSSY